MGKYSAVEQDVFSVFKRPRWTNEGVLTFPTNYVGSAPNNEYIRVSIISGGSGVNLKSTSGILNIDIFVQAGQGPKRVVEIADKLDKHLVGKSLETGSGHTQVGSSNLVLSGYDKDNSALYKAVYSVPFNYFLKD
jgi:hypothetical protein